MPRMGHSGKDLYSIYRRNFSSVQGAGCLKKVLNLWGMSKEGMGWYFQFPLWEGYGSFLKQPNLKPLSVKKGSIMLTKIQKGT